MWYLKGNQKLAFWRNYRISLEKLNQSDQLKEIVSLWKTCHLGIPRYDFQDIKTWPNPWQLILDSDFDDFSRALGMAWSLILIPNFENKSIKLRCYNDIVRSNYYFIIAVDEQYMLNYSYGNIDNIDSLSETAKLICEYGYEELYSKCK